MLARPPTARWAVALALGRPRRGAAEVETKFQAERMNTWLELARLLLCLRLLRAAGLANWTGSGPLFSGCCLLGWRCGCDCDCGDGSPARPHLGADLCGASGALRGAYTRSRRYTWSDSWHGRATSGSARGLSVPSAEPGALAGWATGERLADIGGDSAASCCRRANAPERSLLRNRSRLGSARAAARPQPHLAAPRAGLRLPACPRGCLSYSRAAARLAGSAAYLALGGRRASQVCSSAEMERERERELRAPQTARAQNDDESPPN